MAGVYHTVDIKLESPASPLTWTKCLVVVRPRVPFSTMTCTYQYVNVTHCLLVSSLSWTHQPSYVERILQAPSVSFTHWFVHIRHVLAAIPQTCTYWLRDIGHCLPLLISASITIRQHQVGTTPIALGLHRMITLYRALPPCKLPLAYIIWPTNVRYGLPHPL